MRTTVHYFLGILFCIALFGCKGGGDEGISTYGSGVSGSTARFAINNNYLYVVDRNTLHIFDISNPSKQVKVKDLIVGFDVETLFLRDSLLFIGSSNGVMLYDVTVADSPEFLSQVYHIYSCDPVVADSVRAYATLHSEESSCFRGRNELLILDIRNPRDVSVTNRYDMESPRGLGIYKNALFVCDRGLKAYSINGDSLLLRKKYDISAEDVIPLSNVLLVIGNEGLKQYAYDGENLTLLSTISVSKPLQQ